MASNSESLIIHIYIYLSLRGFETFELVVGYEKMKATQPCRKQFAQGLLGGVLSIRNFLYYRCMLLYFMAGTFINFSTRVVVLHIHLSLRERDIYI